MNGTITEKYLRQGLTRLLATYDQIGSLKVVADAAGNVVKKTEHDSFGNIMSDTVACCGKSISN